MYYIPTSVKTYGPFESPLLALDSDSFLFGLSIITWNKFNSILLLHVLFPSSTTRSPSLDPRLATSAWPVTVLLEVAGVTPLQAGQVIDF
jgi:hypothetical protein